MEWYSLYYVIRKMAARIFETVNDFEISSDSFFVKTVSLELSIAR